ncbi:DUF5134 domain-containing protein [Arthrobacter sp. LAPM80]|uniref:DUF5134 domain-containing protein n=1 Tax=Arthrobacter sp. LAPM80 TaxID=3141788 RepID=UPI00398AB9F3
MTWTLTTILLLSGSHHLLQAARSRHLTDRINQSLHTLMHVLMAAMLWHLGSSFMLAQIAVLAGAALWFILQAVARPEVKMLCTDSRERLKCLYHSLSMAGAALMIAMMDGLTTSSYTSAPTNPMSMSHDHHAMAAPLKNTTTAPSAYSPNLAILLTLFFAAATMTFIILLLLTRTKKNTHPHPGTPQRTHRAEHGIEAIAAAIMALMFATMTT